MNLERYNFISIERLRLSGRVHNALWAEGYDTIGQLLDTSLPELKLIRGIGPVGVQEITTKLKIFDLRLAD